MTHHLFALRIVLGIWHFSRVEPALANDRKWGLGYNVCARPVDRKVLFCYGAECEPAETKVELPASRPPPKTRELLTDTLGLFEEKANRLLIDDASVLERVRRRRYKEADETEQVEDVYW
jgi:hypothetical protein